MDSERLTELNRRNKTLPPHMRSTYATELTYAAKRFPSERLEDELKNSRDFMPYLHKSGGDTSSLVSPGNLSKTKVNKYYIAFSCNHIR